MRKEVSPIIWSIGILSIPNRLNKFVRLFTKLENQIKDLRSEVKIEILGLCDNKSKSIAEKRNDFLQISQGNFLSFLDDDDDISENFVKEIAEALIKSPNTSVVSFKQSCLINGLPLSVTFKAGSPHESLTYCGNGYSPITRPPYHMCVWSRSCIGANRFRTVYTKEGQSIEDIDWLCRIYPSVTSEIHISKVLHYYIYSSKLSESKIN